MLRKNYNYNSIDWYFFSNNFLTFIIYLIPKNLINLNKNLIYCSFQKRGTGKLSSLSTTFSILQHFHWSNI